MNTTSFGFINGVNLPRNPDPFQFSVNQTLDNAVEHFQLMYSQNREIIERLDVMEDSMARSEKNSSRALNLALMTRKDMEKLTKDVEKLTTNVEETNGGIKNLQLYVDLTLNNQTLQLTETIAEEVDAVNKRVDGLEATMNNKFKELDCRIDNLEAKVDDGFAQVNSRIDKLEEKVDNGFAKLNSNLDRIANALRIDLNTAEPMDPRAIHDEARRAADEFTKRPTALHGFIVSVIKALVSLSRTYSRCRSELAIGSRRVAQVVRSKPLRLSPHSFQIIFSRTTLILQSRFPPSLSPSSPNAVHITIALPPIPIVVPLCIAAVP